MNNIGKFEVGTVFVGNINNAKMEVIGIEQERLMTESHRIWIGSKKAVIKDIENGTIHKYGLSALERCNVTIIEESNNI